MAVLTVQGCESAPKPAVPAREPVAPASGAAPPPRAPEPVEDLAAGPDSDGDCIPDARDRYPLIADFNSVSWEVQQIRVGWKLDTETKSEEQTSLTWTKGESTVKTEGRKSLAKGYAGLDIDTSAKGKLNANPLRAFGLADLETSAEVRAKAGISYSGELEWGLKQQEESRRVAERMERISKETRVSDPFVSIWIAIRNHSREELWLTPSALTVFVGDQILESAKPVQRDRADGALRLPPGRPVGVPIEFQAPLNTTAALALLSGLSTDRIRADLAQSGSVILRADGTGSDAIRAAAQIESQTVEISVSDGDSRLSWRVAASDTSNVRAVTLGAALGAINERLSRELSRGRGGLFKLGKTSIESIASVPAHSKDGTWFASIGDREFEKATDLPLDQTLRAGESIALRFMTSPELEEVRYLAATSRLDSPKRAELDRAIASLRELAEGGSASAQRTLGWCYAYGRGVNRDRSEALRWFQRAAKQGDIAAEYNIVMLNWYGEMRAGADLKLPDTFVQTAAERALKPLREIADREYPPAQMAVGLISAVSSDDESLLVPWLEKAASSGYAPAQAWLGDLRLKQALTDGEKADAFRLVQEGADGGCVDAYFMISRAYQSGRFVSRNQEESIKWLRKAALAGHAAAANELGDVYSKRDKRTEAIQWYERAARLGDPGASYDLASLYEEDDRSSRSRAQAVAWFRIALASGYSRNEAFRNLINEAISGLSEKMSKQEIAQAERTARTFVPDEPPPLGGAWDLMR